MAFYDNYDFFFLNLILINITQYLIISTFCHNDFLSNYDLPDDDFSYVVEIGFISVREWHEINVRHEKKLSFCQIMTKYYLYIYIYYVYILCWLILLQKCLGIIWFEMWWKWLMWQQKMTNVILLWCIIHCWISLMEVK